MFLYLRSIKELKPGEKWQKLFNKAWPYYKHWFLQEGFTARVPYLTSKTKLEEYMPELMPTYEALMKLSGDGDVEARFLSHWCPPPYMTACSQLAWNKQPNNFFLIRNYDYSPRLFEGVQLYSNWNKKVIGISDGLWGLLDGINEDGLVVSLTFGGRRVVGEGFGIPLIMRYVLETCSTKEEVIKAFKRIPSHMSYNVTVLDVSGSYSTLFIAPDRETEVLDYPIGTNHQGQVEWEDYAALTETRERLAYLETCLYNHNETKEGLLRKFLAKPLYSQKFEKSFGTLYTSIYNPVTKTAELHWPSKSIFQSFENFNEAKTEVAFSPKFSGKLTL
jgi:predicted choloylglycine hydrolase